MSDIRVDSRRHVLGGQYDHFRRFGVRLRQRFFQHVKVLRRSNGHQFSVFAVESKGSGRYFIRGLAIELIEMLMPLSAQPALVRPFGKNENSQESQRKSET